MTPKNGPFFLIMLTELENINHSHPLGNLGTCEKVKIELSLYLHVK